MRAGIFGGMALAAAAMSLAGSPAGPVIRPEPEHKRYLVKVPSRADRKKDKRRQEHARAIKGRSGYFGRNRACKLGRRLRRKHLLGRSGAY